MKESEKTSVIGEGESPTNAKKAIVMSAGKGSRLAGVELKHPGVVIFDSMVALVVGELSLMDEIPELDCDLSLACRDCWQSHCNRGQYAFS